MNIQQTNSKALDSSINNLDETISVSQLNRLAKTLLENNMPIFWIKGEISSLRTYSHVYFDLKDDAAKISCVIFAGTLKSIDFNLANGQQVEVRGKVTLYAQNGGYQINIERIRKVGVGALWEAYNRLIAKLKMEGLFDEQYKKSIPKFPTSVGVVTSKEGAVIRDVIATLKRRMPNIVIIIYHTLVQGSDASMQIAKAINTANVRHEVDVIIVCRGGGSLEDLWCFNDEIVAREVFTSRIPIISAIGHATDTTIIDFVADVRAPTPTAASEIVSKSRLEWYNLLQQLTNKLRNNFMYIYDSKYRLLDSYTKEIRYLNPLTQLKEKNTYLNQCIVNLAKAVQHGIYKNRNKLDTISMKLDCKKIKLGPSISQLKLYNQNLNAAMYRFLSSRRQKCNYLLAQLNLLNPENVLSRGYAIIKNSNGEIVYSSNDAADGEQINIILHGDNLKAIIDKS